MNGQKNIKLGSSVVMLSHCFNIRFLHNRSLAFTLYTAYKCFRKFLKRKATRIHLLNQSIGLKQTAFSEYKMLPYTVGARGGAVG